jgi:hypothetical protein
MFTPSFVHCHACCAGRIVAAYTEQKKACSARQQAHALVIRRFGSPAVLVWSEDPRLCAHWLPRVCLFRKLEMQLLFVLFSWDEILREIEKK